METNPEPDHDTNTHRSETNNPMTRTATMEPEPTETTDSTHTRDPEQTVTEPMNADSNSEQAHLSPPAPPPPPESRRSWLDVPIARDTEQRRVAGVVAGVSKAYGFDRRTTRVAVALGALVIPGIFALYIAGMIFLPGRGDEPRSLRAIATDRRRRPLMIVLGLLAIATGFGSWAFWGGVGWGFALVAIGVVLWLAPNLGRASETQQASSIPPDGAPPSLTPTTSTTPTTTRTRRRRYPIQAIGLAAAYVGALIAGIANSVDWWNISTYSIVFGVLIALIAATIIGATVNRSWFGIPMLLILGASAVGLGITHPNLDGGIGERTFRPTTLAEAQVAQHLGIGRLTVDLTDVPLGEQPLTIQASVGYGQVRVIVPADAELRIVSDINAGHLVINGDETSSGLHREDTLTVPARSAGGAKRTIVLDLDVGGGELNVSQTRS